MNHPNTLSYWERDSFLNDIDVLIIGEGIVGLSAALSLRERYPSAKIAIAERGALPEGASTRNAGFACFGSVTELLDDLENQSEAAVFALLEKRFRGLNRLRTRVGDEHMHYEELGGYEVFKETDKTIFEKCADQIAYFNRALKDSIGREAVYRIVPQNFGFKNMLPTMIWNVAEGQIDTGKMMTRLIRLAQSQGIQIFNGLGIEKLLDTDHKDSHIQRTSYGGGEGGVILETEAGWDFKVRKLIVATNGFARRLLPELAVVPARNQVLVTKPIPHLPIKGCFHYDKGYFYFRNIGNRLLLGGGRNLDFETEQTEGFGTTDRIQNALLQLLSDSILPNQKVEIDTWWSGILGVGAVKKPIIERVSPNIIVAVRMGGMGVAIGSLVGEEAADLVHL